MVSLWVAFYTDAEDIQDPFQGSMKLWPSFRKAADWVMDQAQADGYSEVYDMVSRFDHEFYLAHVTDEDFPVIAWVMAVDVMGDASAPRVSVVDG